MSDAKTDLDLLVGLCVGHDLIFAHRSAAPVTTLVVKDRVLAHNPAGALHTGYGGSGWASPGSPESRRTGLLSFVT